MREVAGRRGCSACRLSVAPGDMDETGGGGLAEMDAQGIKVDLRVKRQRALFDDSDDETGRNRLEFG